MNAYRDLQAKLGATGKGMAQRLEVSACHWSNICCGREWTDGPPPEKAELLAALWAEAGMVEPIETTDDIEVDATIPVDPPLSPIGEKIPEPEAPGETQGQVEADEDFTEIPDAMKAAQRWLVWRSIQNGDRKPRKVPYYADGTPRHGTLDGPEDLAKLATFDDAVRALRAGGFSGLGFSLGLDNSGVAWQGIDLDDTDGRPELAALIDLLPGYVERSPSGKGVHAVGYGKPFASLGSNRSGIEAYAGGRYFTVTGSAIGGDIEDISQFVVRTLAPLHRVRPEVEATAAATEHQHTLVPDQVRDLRSALAALRADDRDLWVRMGLALKSCGDVGRGLWVEWSQGSAKFDPADASRVWESFTPVSTDFRAVFTEAQAAGWINPKAKPEKAKAPAPNADADQLPRFEIVEFKKGYRNGVYYVYEDAEGNIERDWICSPLRVTARTRAKASDAWGYLLEWADPDGIAHSWAMSAELLAGSGDEYRRALLDGGLEIAPGATARSRLTSYIQGARTEARSRCVERTGWHDGAFVLPDRVIGGTGDEGIVFQRAAGSTSHYAQSGTLEEWREGVASLCVGNSRLAFAVSTAFASVLLDLTGDENGGVHYQGGSSIGKSTALYVACSVFGGRDYLHRWRATTNGLEAVAVGHSGALLCLDELGEIDPKEAGETSYMLSNGQGKARALQSGGARRRQSWRLLFLSSGEIDLSQHMLSVGKRARAGQEIRLLNIPAAAGTGFGLFDHPNDFATGKALADAINRRTLSTFGTAGPAFIEAVAQDIRTRGRDMFVAQLRAIQDVFVREHLPQGASEQVGRAIQRFGLIGIGGELATRYGITGWTPGEASRAAARCFQAWRSERGTDGNQESAAILSQVRRFFEAHGEARFHDWDQPTERAIVNRAGVRRVEDDTWVYYVLPETFRSEIASGFAIKQVVEVLDTFGLLTRGTDGRPASVQRLPGIGMTRAYKLRPFTEVTATID